jgi:hypothetical protein
MDSLCLGHTFQLKLCREDRRDGDETGGWMRLGNDPELERNESASVSSGSHSVSLCPVPTTSTAFPFVALARIAAGVPRSNRSNLGPSERRPNTTGSTRNPKPSMRRGAIQPATANGRSKLQHTSNERDTPWIFPFRSVGHLVQPTYYGSFVPRISRRTVPYHIIRST